LREALAAARAITDADDRAEALAALAPHLPPDLLREALAAARAITDADDRAEALAALAPHLAATPMADAAFLPTLRLLAQRGRPALLGGLAALAPWLAAVAARAAQPAAPALLAQAIVDTARCWP
ncbi:MAG: hypothetical protein ACUVS4_12110, partial [Chloroflexaceae bacterium]